MNQNARAAELVYQHEPPLSIITMIFGLLFWLAIILLTFGAALFYILIGFVFYLFVQSGFIAWIKGTAVKLTPEQFPDLYVQYLHCCERLGIKDRPECYIVNGAGMLNAFATRFMGRNFVVLLSDIVDAMQDKPEGINFYIGHELGHIRMKHLTGHIWRAPALWMPLLGAAYSRAQEYTCDLHGRACCNTPETAAQALVVLASGPERWKTTNIQAYVDQAKSSSDFWPSFHELTAAYPWLTKRVARMLNPHYRAPGRNPVAFILACFIPNAGRLAGGFGGLLSFLVVLAIMGILAAVAIPAYKDYTQRAAVLNTWQDTAGVRNALAEFYQAEGHVPDSLEEAGLSEDLPNGDYLWLDTDDMTVSIYLSANDAELLMVPKVSEEASNGIEWRCEAGDGIETRHLPLACR